MKTIFIFLLVLMMSISFAAAFPVDITYTAPVPMVADVPFTLTVNMRTNSQPVLSYNLFVTSTDTTRARFTNPSRGILFSNNLLSSNSGSLDNGATFRYQVQPHVSDVANTATSTPLFTLQTRIPGLTATSVQLKRAGAAIHSDNAITAQAAGSSVEITDAPLATTPEISICGDGVVGYVDTDRDGMEDSGQEVREACDEGSTGVNNNNAPGGCSALCTYIELGYDCTNKQFGNRLSVCRPIPPKDFLIQKLTALIQGQCYPYCTHPAALYKSATSTNPHLTYDATTGKLDPSEKIYMITQIGVALREFFGQVVTPSGT